MSDDEYKAELSDIKQNVKNLGDCLHAVLKRIEELDKKKPVVKVVKSSSPDNLGGGESTKQVQVRESEHTDEDGTHTKRVHITERVVHTKTFQTVSTAYAARLCRFNKSAAAAAGSSSGGSAAVSSPILQGLSVHPENGQLLVDEVKKDSAIAKTGLLKVGDHVLEVNGKEVKSVDELEKAWKDAGDTLTLKIVPGAPETPSPDAKYIKSLYDYDCREDKEHPCADIGLSFKAGDVLHVVNCDDPNWWQARKVNDLSRVGYIPSRKLEESRRGISEPTIVTKVGSLFSKRRKDGDDGGKELNAPYEEVGKLSPYGRRVLVLLGAPGVGRRTLKSMILAHDPNNFATVTPYTSRTKREGEQEGREYHFVKRDAIQKEVDRGGYVEWGEYNSNLYGTSVQSVRDVIHTGRVCVLDCSPQASRYLYTKEFMPYIVFIAPPSFEELKQLYQVHPNRTKNKTDDDLKRTCDESGKLEAQYKNLIDLVLVNRNVDVTFRRLVDALESLKVDTQWVPASWIH